MRVTDLFCGAGGSSSGMVAAGLEVVTAANHWKIALDTHAENHPNTRHEYVDLREAHPSWFERTEILWASPECTNHTVAKGKKRKTIPQKGFWGVDEVDPEAERSRATMREVVEFSAHHRYEAVIVENVSEVRSWEHYKSWLAEMHKLGYEHKEVFLNSRHAYLTPQSRDRIYIVFWKHGNKAPNLDIQPVGYCQRCEKEVSGVFSPHSNGLPDRVLYGKSYVYSCPECKHRVEPYFRGSETVIDWSIPTTPIKDKGLVANTLNRIRAGLKKYNGETFIASYYSRDSAHAPTTQPMPTIPTENRHALIVPKPFISTYYKNGSNISVEQPAPTVTTKDRLSLICPTEDWSLNEAGYRMLEAHELKIAMGFPVEYRILGTQTQIKKQIGNAVTCGSAQLLAEAVIESLN